MEFVRKFKKDNKCKLMKSTGRDDKGKGIIPGSQVRPIEQKGEET
jgi:hypothetical protein